MVSVFMRITVRCTGVLINTFMDMYINIALNFPYLQEIFYKFSNCSVFRNTVRVATVVPYNT
jgi:hypothetical protein